MIVGRVKPFSKNDEGYNVWCFYVFQLEILEKVLNLVTMVIEFCRVQNRDLDGIVALRNSENVSAFVIQLGRRFISKYIQVSVNLF